MAQQNPQRSTRANGKGTAPHARRPWRWIATASGVALLGVFAWVWMRDTPSVEPVPTAVSSGDAAGFNVLLITLDTTRADRLGCYGRTGAQTPVLDSLAKRGMRFDDAVTVAPITLPAHATILTGLNPPRHGIRHNGEFRLDAAHETLAEILKDRGYGTAAFVSAFVLDARFGLDQGFDLYDDDVSTVSSATVTAFSKPVYERSAGRVTNAAIRWLETRDRDRPFFAWVHYFDPHNPYRPPPPFSSRFRDRPYEGEIAYMDSQIGRLLQTLVAQDQHERTVVIAVADHGEGLGEHDETTHAKLIYDSTMRVPLIISSPELFPSPVVVDDVVVSIADVFPTVLDLLGIDAPASLDGKSLLRPSESLNRSVYMETLAPYFDNGWSPLYGLRRHGDKYILAPTPEYYDLNVDPGELVNLFETAKGGAKAARDNLATTLAGQLAASAPLEAVVATAQTLDPEAIRRLEALGYVGSIATTEKGDSLPDPKDVMSVLKKIDQASALSRAGRYKEALTVIAETISLSPHDPVLLLTQGKTYLFMDRIADAEATFHEVHALRPSARVCVLLAQIMLADGRLDEADQFLDEAHSLDPAHGGVYLARGDYFALQARPDDAITAYEQARLVDPNRAGAEAKRRIERIEEIRRMIGTPPPKP